MRNCILFRGSCKSHGKCDLYEISSFFAKGSGFSLLWLCSGLSACAMHGVLPVFCIFHSFTFSFLPCLFTHFMGFISKRAVKYKSDCRIDDDKCSFLLLCMSVLIRYLKRLLGLLVFIRLKQKQNKNKKKKKKSRSPVKIISSPVKNIMK